MYSLSDDHQFLAPNEYSFDTIGIHNYLIRPSETEQLTKLLRQAIFAEDPIQLVRCRHIRNNESSITLEPTEIIWSR